MPDIALDVECDSEDLRGTPERIKRMWQDSFKVEDVSEYFKAKYNADYNELIVIRGIEVSTFCPHHFLDVELVVHIGYLPNKQVLGLSKFARVADALTKPPKKQEDYTVDLAEAIYRNLEPKWVMVVVVGKHGCMRGRGVKQRHCDVITSAIRGGENLETRKEFLELLKL